MANQKVLVVDDDPATCNLVETFLKLEGFETTAINRVANDDFVSILNIEEPDIILLDYHLGSQETTQFVKAIRANEQWAGLPIIMTSAIDYSRDCFKVGATDFIVKHFDWASVTDRIRSILSDSIYQEE